MNKKVLKLFISLFAIFIFATHINASVVNCNPKEKPVTIDETSKAVYAGFEATMPTCNWVGTGNFVQTGDAFTSFSDAKGSGYTLEKTLVESFDAKSWEEALVPRCADESRQVKAIATCYNSIKLKYGTESRSCSGFASKEFCTSKVGCTWKQPASGAPYQCSGTYLASYSYCPDDSYTKNVPNGTCDKTITITKNSITGDLSDADIKQQLDGNWVSPYNCKINYYLMCPEYKCKRVYKQFSLCTPEFKIDGQPAYCVNPSQGFEEAPNNYEYDSSFNVFDCASSYSTPDCGYANVLIEGAYYDASDISINTALRLWGVHSGQAGYGLNDYEEPQKTGVANLTGKNCNDITYFTTGDDGRVVNVYRETHEYIMAKFYATAKTYYHIPPESSCYSKSSLKNNNFYNLLEISCNSNDFTMSGVMCGKSEDYRVGFELFFNTLIGNKCMKEHLSTLYHGENGSKPIAATLQSEYSFEESNSSSEVETWVEVKFEQESFWNEIKDEVVECSDEKLEELKKKLMSEGKTESEAEEILNQIRPYCETKVTVIDSDGNEIVSEQEMYACIKDSGCITTKFKFAICDIIQYTEKNIEIKVVHQKNRSSYSVRKYNACANAKVNQTLFAFFDESDESNGGNASSETGDPQVEETLFTVTNYKCSGGCEDPNTRTQGNSSCENDTSNYNGVYTSKVKDPSLRCIVNLDEASAKKFDYSDYFGVNSNFCRIYCSDEMEYVLADKVKAISGRTFMYNIEFPAMGTNKLDYRLSSIVKEKRTCVSEIYYHRLGNVESLIKDYGIEDHGIVNGVDRNDATYLRNSNTIDGLLKVLERMAKDQNNRDEVINQVLYDIYNCNLHSEETITSKNIYKPKNYSKTIIQKINEIYSSANNYGLNTDASGKAIEKKNEAKVYYKFGAEIKDTDSRVDVVSNSSKYTGRILKDNNGNIKISYCKGLTTCYSYDSSNDDGSYNYPTSNYNSVTKTLLEKDYTVPTNDFARFEVSSEMNFYNNEKYQVDMGSGKVVLGSSNSELMTLPSYSYPIDKNAYNLPECQLKDENGNLIEGGKYHRCSITQSLNPLTFYRNYSANKLVVNDDNRFTCYVDVGMPNCDPSKENCIDKTQYRNVNPAEMVLVGESFEYSNWKTPEGQSALTEIKTSASKLTIDETYKDYSITLTPTQIKNIREYNKQSNTYIDEVIYNCENKDGYYYNCHSMFMDILRGSATEYENGEFGNLTVDKTN